MIIFQIYPMSIIIISVCTTREEAFVAKQGVERKDCAATL